MHRTAAYLGGIGEVLGINQWADDLGRRPWPSTVEEREAMVEDGVYREEDQVPRPGHGYHVALEGRTPSLLASVQVEAGRRGDSANFPMHRVRTRLYPAVGHQLSTAAIDSLVRLTVEIWDPIMVSFSTRALVSMDWGIHTGWRVWLRHDLGSVTTTVDGVTARDLAGGTLIAASDEWSTEQVKSAVGATLTVNGLTTLPFGGRPPSRQV